MKEKFKMWELIYFKREQSIRDKFVLPLSQFRVSETAINCTIDWVFNISMMSVMIVSMTSMTTAIDAAMTQASKDDHCSQACPYPVWFSPFRIIIGTDTTVVLTIAGKLEWIIPAYAFIVTMHSIVLLCLVFGHLCSIWMMIDWREIAIVVPDYLIRWLWILISSILGFVLQFLQFV